MNSSNLKIIIALVTFSFSGAVNAQEGMKWVFRNVIDSHPLVQTQKAQLNAAGKDVDSSKWGFYPTPSIGYETADKLPYGSLDKSSSYFRLQQPIWTAGRLTAQLDKAQSQYLVAESSVQEQRLDIAWRIQI